MASPAVTSRLGHLNNAAHSLAVNAPSISSYLFSQYNRFAFENELILPDARGQQICGACGNMMILGWTGHISMQTQTPLRQRKKPAKTQRGAINKSESHPIVSKAERRMIYECSLCSRKTEHPIYRRSKQRPSESKRLYAVTLASSQQASAMPASSMASPEPIPGAFKQGSNNASSKKRTKARKQGGLQAMLAKRKEEAAKNDTSGGGFGLDLMDILKSG
ncbi:MAG: hypothetical protein M1827_002501 [Pycnora praestabilis]|nr:MAG: hypothetical protein M1827_002501 [Pycnora praestabilis]